MIENGNYIRFDHVSKSFGSQKVLDSLCLSISKGESIVIIGRSGCGKSVLLKHLIGLMLPDSGSVHFDNADISLLQKKELIAVRRKIGFLFQSAALFDSMNVAENVGLGLTESRQYSSEEVSEIVHQKLKLVGLSDAATKSPSELSGGMRKRVGLARALATDPEVLLYDEPTTGLDPITADMINNLITQLWQKLHVTTVAVTHDMTSAYKIASRIVMLHQGKILFEGTPDEIVNSGNPIVDQFINGREEGPIAL